MEKFERGQVLEYNSGRGKDVVKFDEELKDMLYMCRVELLTGCMTGNKINVPIVSLTKYEKYEK